MTYGFTPNVYRPSEVPYPGTPEDLLITPGTGTTLNLAAAGWFLVFDDAVLHTLSALGPTTPVTVTFPRVAPVYCLLVHFSLTTAGVAGTASFTSPLSVSTPLIPINTTAKGILHLYFYSFGSYWTSFHVRTGQLVMEDGTGTASLTANATLGTFHLTPSEDVWDATIQSIPLTLTLSSATLTFTLHHTRVYAANAGAG